MKRLILFLLLLAGAMPLLALADGGTRPPVMHLSPAEMQAWKQNHDSARSVYLEPAFEEAAPAFFSLLPQLDYVPAERNQGTCGNCWVWAGTGVMAIDHETQEDVFDRLSIQYLDSCYVGRWACCGGNLWRFADFYRDASHAIPWANDSAEYQDGSTNCDAGRSSVSCSSIATEPDYVLNTIDPVVVPTHYVTHSQAIANIKNVLLQGRAIYFAFCLPTQADWNSFYDFWNTAGEESVWHPAPFQGKVWDKGGGCHATLLVGWDETDPDDPYWLVLNSWGTANGTRPEGTFRVSMDMDYADWQHHGTFDTWAFWFETLDIAWGGHPPVADAGEDQVLECTGDLAATATLDGSGSSDPDSTPGTNDDIVAFDWFEDGTLLGSGEVIDHDFQLGDHTVRLRVTDSTDLTDDDHVLVTVQDTTAPAGKITFPADGSCFGPDAVPVVVQDDIEDVCDPDISRTYQPPGGPSYEEHGTYDAHVLASDRSGNTLDVAVSFAIDLVPPTVVIHEPPRRAVIPDVVPFRVLFEASDDDGATGDVVHEVIYLDGCPVYDGDVYGDGDGLLHDEDLVVTVANLCEIAKRCGQTEWHNPIVAVRAWDCGGNQATEAHQIIGDYQLIDGVCP